MSLHDLLETSARSAGASPGDVDAAIAAEAERLALDPRLIDRPLNVDLSGGEKKKNETLQLGVLRPAIALLDELDSGLDVDALRACARRIEAETQPVAEGGTGLGVLAITHYNRLLHELPGRRRARAGHGARSCGRVGPSWRSSSRTAATPACSAPSWRARTRARPSRCARRSTTPSAVRAAATLRRPAGLTHLRRPARPRSRRHGQVRQVVISRIITGPGGGVRTYCSYLATSTARAALALGPVVDDTRRHRRPAPTTGPTSRGRRSGRRAARLAAQPGCSPGGATPSSTSAWRRRRSRSCHRRRARSSRAPGGVARHR